MGVTLSAGVGDGRGCIPAHHHAIRQNLTFCVVCERPAGAADLVRAAGARATRASFASPPESAARRGADDKGTRVASGQWHGLEVIARGDQFTVFFDGRQLFAARDGTFSAAGKIGLSTKSDGVTMFDDLQVTVFDAQGARP